MSAWVSLVARIVLLLLAALVLGACGGGGRPDTPVSVALIAPVASIVTEADDRTVPVTVLLDRPAPTALTVPLQFSGSATRDRDYAAGADSVVVPAGAVSGDVLIDVYRDFDAEEDESVIVELGELEAAMQAGRLSSVTLTLLDGGPATLETQPFQPGIDATLIPIHRAVTPEFFELGLLVFSAVVDRALTLTAEWSTDVEFLTDVHPIAEVDILPPNPGDDIFDRFVGLFQPHEFALPLSVLGPDGQYFIRVYLATDSPPAPETGDSVVEQFLLSFATDASGKVVTRCEPPARDPGPAGTDPLFAEQWHLSNTGQTAFSNSAGVAGADLRMAAATGAGHGGEGVKIAVIDTGLEICHPDLAGNVPRGQSYNFAYEASAGALPTDPFNIELHGDHGTSVAGVAAAVANNGVGGRGVAPQAQLVGFNVGASVWSLTQGDDPEVAMFKSLGASNSDPDSASVDIFNMSFGTELPSGNSSEDFVRLVKMGTDDLRDGRGALYVKAAGNEFGVCRRTHPLNSEIGCIGSNADPDHNLPYMVVVGAFNAADVKSSYSSAGANIWVVGPAGEDGVEHPAIITTDQAGTHAGFDRVFDSGLTSAHPLNRDGDYLSAFGGTSSATPAVAGAIAVVLGAYPQLTWRDVKHVLAGSARRIDPDRPRVRAAFNGRPYVAQHAWQTNAAGYAYHNWYGFGAADIDRALALASSHLPGSLGKLKETPWFGPEEQRRLAIPDADGAGVTDAVSVAGLPDTSNLEAVVLRIAVEHDQAWDLGVTITSPAGTQSVVNAPFNAVLDQHSGLQDWQLLSNAFYGENPNGDWRVQVVDLNAGDTGELTSWALRFHYGEHP